jgi:hypothetical protein
MIQPIAPASGDQHESLLVYNPASRICIFRPSRVAGDLQQDGDLYHLPRLSGGG